MKLSFNRKKLDLSRKIGKRDIGDFVDFITRVSRIIGFKVSSRGWAYILEQKGFITKAEFDKVENLINRCRREGLLPVDFVAEESARAFKEVHKPTKVTVKKFVKNWAESVYDFHDWYEPNWWQGEKYYIQMIVEKIDLVTLFRDICAEYHIPIANAKGWSSISQRAEYARRFKDAEAKGLQCVLLYCGDHDPDGLRISDTLRKNLEQLIKIKWYDGVKGYDPINLKIERFGLNFAFISEHNLTWIDNLITGSKKNLACSSHNNYYMPYVQDYLKTVGERKCEANSLVIKPEAGQKLCEDTIKKYLGEDAKERFRRKKRKKVGEIKEVVERIKLVEGIEESLDKL